jgi:hypothetical protein
MILLGFVVASKSLLGATASSHTPAAFGVGKKSQLMAVVFFQLLTGNR